MPRRPAGRAGDRLGVAWHGGQQHFADRLRELCDQPRAPLYGVLVPRRYDVDRIHADKRSLTNPVQVGYNLLSGVASPTVGTVQPAFYYKTAQNDQSFYGQEQLVMLDNKLTVTAGLDGERSTINERYQQVLLVPPLLRIVPFAEVGFFDEIKLRAAYGQSGNLGNYGSKYTPYNPNFIDGVGGIQLPSSVG